MELTLVDLKVAEVAKSSNAKLYCQLCDYSASNRYNFAKHLLTAKHQKKTWLSKEEKVAKKYQKVAEVEKACPLKYYCQLCDYSTSKTYNFNKHLTTSKHQKNTRPPGRIKCPFCSKKFKSRQGRWKHEKKCLLNPETLQQKLAEANQKIKMLESKNVKNKVEYLEEALENEKESHQKTRELKTSGGIQNNINMNFFLNEKCKNAVPIMDFIKNLQFTLTDINPQRPASTIESLSKVITDKLSDMDINERPVHCSDVKRLNFYVKDEDGWTKDNEKIDTAIDWANMRHQGAWYKRVQEKGLDKTEEDTNYHMMNVAMAKFSDDPSKAKRKIKKAIATVTSGGCYPPNPQLLKLA